MGCHTEPTASEIAHERGIVREAMRKEILAEFEHNSSVAELLCSVMKELDRTKGFPGQFSPQVLNWWKEHKNRDEAKAILDKIREKEARVVALAKLTEHEKKLLGLK